MNIIAKFYKKYNHFRKIICKEIWDFRVKILDRYDKIKCTIIKPRG